MTTTTADLTDHQRRLLDVALRHGLRAMTHQQAKLVETLNSSLGEWTKPEGSTRSIPPMPLGELQERMAAAGVPVDSFDSFRLASDSALFILRLHAGKFDADPHKASEYLEWLDETRREMDLDAIAALKSEAA